MGKNSCQKGLLLHLERIFHHRSLCFPLEHTPLLPGQFPAHSLSISMQCPGEVFRREGQEAAGQGDAGLAPAPCCGRWEVRQQQGPQALGCKPTEAFLAPLPQGEEPLCSLTHPLASPLPNRISLWFCLVLVLSLFSPHPKPRPRLRSRMLAEPSQHQQPCLKEKKKKNYQKKHFATCPVLGQHTEGSGAF